MASFASYKLPIDGKWSLEDLYRFPHAYEQVYYAVEAISPSGAFADEERIRRTFRAFPWRGGYSSVNFYSQLKYATDKEFRPTIISLKYASPGWIELWLHLPQAIQISSVVTSIAGSLLACNKLYNQIQTDLQKRKLLRIEVERQKLSLSSDEIKLVREGAHIMSEILSLGSPDVADSRTRNPLVSLKILLSAF